MAGNLFFGFDVSLAVQAYVVERATEVRSLASDAEWPLDKLHVTVLFVGKESTNTEEHIKRADVTLPSESTPVRRFTVDIGAPGMFNDRVLYFGVTVPQEIVAMQGRLAGNSDKLWIPHLTVAKNGSKTNIKAACTALQRRVQGESVSCTVGSIKLYRTLGEGRPYETLKAWYLK